MIVGDYTSYEQKSILSAPIFMDNVACYGSEDKLINCTYHTDTTEDDHSNDIWINCDTIEQSTTEQSSDQSTAKAALSISLVLLVFFIIVIVILITIAVLLYKHKSGTSTTER